MSHLWESKRSEMGLATLILFISLLMIAAIATGVLLQTSSSIQETSLSTSTQAKSQISTSIEPVELILLKDDNGEYRWLQQMVKLVPGSEPIRLQDLTIFINLPNTAATLSYRGTDGVANQSASNGFFTRGSQELGATGVYHATEGNNIVFDSWNGLDIDLDLDGTNERISFCMNDGGSFCSAEMRQNQTYVAVKLSSFPDAEDEYAYVKLLNSTGGDMEICVNDGDTTSGNDMTPIIKEGETYGYLTITGDHCDGCCFVDNSNLDIDVHITRVDLTEDIDKDGDAGDYLWVNETHVTFYFTNGQNISIPFTEDISNPVTLSVDSDIEDSEGNIYGSVVLDGTTTTNNVINEDITFTIVPDSITGSYVAEYIHLAEKSKVGNLAHGDTIKFYMMTPRSIGDSEVMTIKLVSKNGYPVTTEVETRSALVNDVYRLFP